MNEGKQAQRLRVFAGIVMLMFAALATRLWFLQVLAAERYQTAASENSIREIEVGAPRGRILDRNGVPLVENDKNLQITVNRQQTDADRETVVRNLSELLSVTPEVLTERVENQRYYPFAPVPVAFDVDPRIVYAITEYPDDFPGVDVQTVGARRYPKGDIAAHVLGHIGVLYEEDAANPAFDDYAPDEPTGRDGIENSYESDLRGEKGIIRKRVNAQGKVQGTLDTLEPVSGNDVVLTLDAELQAKTENLLANAIDRVKGSSGAAVVMDAKTGGIVSIASYPSYSPTVYDNGINENERKELGLQKFCLDESGSSVPCSLEPRELKEPPLLNVATQGLFAPGSTIKPFVVLAALRDGISTTNEKIDCPPEWSPPTDPDAPPFRNWNPLDKGTMDLRQAIVESCDTVFYVLGFRYWEKYHKGWDEETGNALVGVDKFQRSLEAFGFGSFTGIDLPTGQDGVIPDQLWKYNTFYNLIPKGVTKAKYHSSDYTCEYNWCPGDSVQMAIGQKDVQVTPLQLTAAFAAIANDGTWCRPHLGLRVQTPSGKTVRTIKPDCHRLEGFPSDSFGYVRKGMEGAVRNPDGTADAAFEGFPFTKVDVIGKTGTAEVDRQIGEDNAWFSAIAKGEDKDKNDQTYVVTVLVERGGHGGSTAAPIARQIIEAAFGLGDSGFHPGEVSD